MVADQNTGWLSWNIDILVGGTYTITSATSGNGGAYVILVNEVNVASALRRQCLRLHRSSPGYYDIKIRSTSNAAFQVNQVLVALSGAPASPTLISAFFANVQSSLNWSAVPGVAGYIIAYGNATGAYTHFVNVGNVLGATLSGLDKTQVLLFRRPGLQLFWPPQPALK